MQNTPQYIPKMEDIIPFVILFKKKIIHNFANGLVPEIQDSTRKRYFFYFENVSNCTLQVYWALIVINCD